MFCLTAQAKAPPGPYKVQWYDPTSLCWFDIQKQHPTAEAARAAYPRGILCSIMEVTKKGRRPI